MSLWTIIVAILVIFLVYKFFGSKTVIRPSLKVSHSDLLLCLPDSVQDKLMDSGEDEKPASDAQLHNLQELGFNVKEAWSEHVAEFAVFVHETTASYFNKPPSHADMQYILYGATDSPTIISKFYRLYTGKGDADKLDADLIKWVQKEVVALRL